MIFEREQDVLFFRHSFWRILSVLSCFPSRWDIISLPKNLFFRRWLTLAHLQKPLWRSLKSNIAMVTKFPVLQQLHFSLETVLVFKGFLWAGCLILLQFFKLCVSKCCSKTIMTDFTNLFGWQNMKRKSSDKFLVTQRHLFLNFLSVIFVIEGYIFCIYISYSMIANRDFVRVSPKYSTTDFGFQMAF